MLRGLEIAIHQFAKRQMTWFRGMERRGFTIHWIDALQPMEQKVEQVLELIEQKAFQNLKGLLYFTDGYGTFPRKRPNYDTAFIFYHEDYMDTTVPPWAMKLIIGKEDLELKNNEK